MLIMNKHPVITCLDFYNFFDVSDILYHPVDFIPFFKGHLALNPINRRCIELFTMAAENKLPEKQFKFSSQFWLGEKPENIPKNISNTIEEVFFYCKKNMSGGEFNRSFILISAAHIIGEKTFNAVYKTVGVSKKYIDLSKVDKIKVLPGNTYYCKTNTSMTSEPFSTHLRNIEIAADVGYSSPAFLVDDTEKATYSIESGGILHVTATGAEVVRVLIPGKGFERNIDNGTINYLGEKTQIPFRAASFAYVGKNIEIAPCGKPETEYVYIHNGKLRYIGARQIDNYLFSDTYVEVMRYDHAKSYDKTCSFLLLKADGMVIVVVNGRFTKKLAGFYPSLNAAIKENKKCI